MQGGKIVDQLLLLWSPTGAVLWATTTLSTIGRTALDPSGCHETAVASLRIRADVSDDEHREDDPGPVGIVRNRCAHDCVRADR